MKKYVKPNITFFELNLSTEISTGCRVNATFDVATCPVELPGHNLTVFQKGMCDVYAPDAQDAICYHVPTADINVFES